MATTTEVGVKISVDGSEATKSVGSIKSQLKEATAELIAMREKFGDTSAEAVTASKKVAKLKDAIGDAKAMADAFNPDAKFKAFGTALQGVAGGFSAVQGAMGLLGSDSKEVEQALLKVNSAMALSQGINSVLEAKDGFKNLISVVKSYTVVQKLVTTAQYIWNAAMAANPIGAIVVVITALIAGVVALTSYFMSNAKAARENAKAVKENANALEQQKKATAKASDELQRAQSYQLAMAKANGETTASIRALELKLIDEKIATQQASRETAINTFEKNKNVLASLKQAGASDEVIKKQQETTTESLKYANEQTANLNKSLIDRVELERKHNVEIAQEQTNANKEAEQKAKQEYEKRLEAQKKANEERKKADEDFAKELQALRDKNFTDAIKNENDKAEALLTLQFTNDIKALNASKLSEEQKNAMRIELGKQYQIQLDAINAKRDEEAQKQVDEIQKKEQERIAKNNEQRSIDYENSRLKEEQRQKYLKDQADERIRLDELERKTKIDSATAIGNSLGQLSDLVGKQTAVGKGLAIAQATINTYLGASEVLRAKSVLPEPIGTISKVINVATIIATGIKSIKAIIGTKVPNAGGGGGGSVSAPSLAGGTVAPPLPPQLATQTINAGQINQLASATARAYVVESDVSGNQERINRLNRASRIN
jgi:hypothetical protein